jgi:hypothetical protein
MKKNEHETPPTINWDVVREQAPGAVTILLIITLWLMIPFLLGVIVELIN